MPTQRIRSTQTATAAATEPDTALTSLTPDGFHVHDAASADWLVRKVVEADAHLRRVKEQAEKELRRTQRERDFLLLRYGPELERWARHQLQQHQGRRKSVLLLSGTVGFRKQREKLVVDNAAKVLVWAKKHCRKAVVVVERLSKTTLREHLVTTGELPSGVRLEAAGEKFYVK